MKSLSHPKFVGFLLFIVSIILIVVVWVVSGQTEMQLLPRLMVMLCLPPGVISLLIGIYILVVPPRV